MNRLIALAVVVGAALILPPVRTRVAWLLARAGRGTHVGVVPARDRR